MNSFILPIITVLVCCSAAMMVLSIPLEGTPCDVRPTCNISEFLQQCNKKVTISYADVLTDCSFQRTAVELSKNTVGATDVTNLPVLYLNKTFSVSHAMMDAFVRMDTSGLAIRDHAFRSNNVPKRRILLKEM